MFCGKHPQNATEFSGVKARKFCQLVYMQTVMFTDKKICNFALRDNLKARRLFELIGECESIERSILTDIQT